MRPKYEMHGSESMHWLGMADKSFDEICIESNIRPEWREWEFIQKHNLYSDKILKPINLYCEHFGIVPEIKSLENGKLLFNYFNYSDIYIYNKGYIFYATEKSWMRQFYPISKINKDVSHDLVWHRPLKFFIPWIIDADVKYEVLEGEYADSIYVLKQEGSFLTPVSNRIKNTNFINFYFKDFLNNNGYCIIKRGTNIFSLLVEAGPLKDRIISEYNQIHSFRK